MLLKIIINEPTVSLNVINRWLYRKETYRLNDLKNLYGYFIRCAMRDTPLERNYDHPRHVEVHRYSNRKLDHDNFVGGCKYLLDALVKAGVLADDSPQWVTVDYRQYIEKDRTFRRTEVLVFEKREDERDEGV